jgi:hypothetical protein
VFLRNPIFCLSHQFFFNQCCAPSMVQFEKMQTFFGEKKSLNVSNVKLLSNFVFSVLWVFLMPFCFQALIKGKQVSICCFFTFYCLKQPLKLKKFQNSLRNKRCMQNRPEIACNINSIKTG